MASRKYIWAPRVAIILLTLAVAYLFSPYLAAGVRSATGAMMIVVFLTAYLFTVIVLPLMFYALLKFAYIVFARPYLRLWRLQRMRNARYMKEVIKRSRPE